MRSIRATAAAAAAAATTAAVIAATAGGQAPQGRTITLTESPKGASFGFVDNAPRTTFTKEGEPRRLSPGDVEVESVALTGEQGDRIGRFDAHCVIVRPGRPSAHEEECTGVYRLEDGTISAALAHVGADVGVFRAAITGGTGAYESAGGAVTLNVTSRKTTHTLHLLP
jgi:hypothetical protein